MVQQHGWTEDRLSHITDLFYRSLTDSQAWQSALDALTALFPNGKGVLLIHDAAASRGAFALASGIDPATNALYNAYYNTVNSWMPGAAARPVGVGVRAEHMLLRQQLLRTEFYADWLRPQGIITGVGLTVSRQRNRSFLLSICGADADHESWNAGAGLLSALNPHLSRIVEMHRLAGASGLDESRVDPLLAATDSALLAVGDGRRLLWSNAPGARLADTGEIVRIAPDGSVRLLQPEANDLLGRMLAGSWLDDALPRSASFGMRTAGGKRFRIDLANASRSPLERHLRGACAFVLARREPMRRADLPGEMRIRFGLTPREIDIAVALGEGRSIASIAEGLSLAKETVRVHVKSIFAKLGVRRQSEVVSTVYGLLVGDDGGG